MGTQDVVSSGQGYMTTPMGAGPGFGVNNEGSGHNTGIGVSGAGTGTSGYHHGTGALITFAVACLSFQRTVPLLCTHAVHRSSSACSMTKVFCNCKSAHIMVSSLCCTGIKLA